MKYSLLCPTLFVVFLNSSIQAQEPIHSQIEVREATIAPGESYVSFHIQENGETSSSGESVSSSESVAHTYTLLENASITTHVNITATIGEEVNISCNHKGKLASETDANRTIDLSQTGFQADSDSSMRWCPLGAYPIHSQGNNLIHIETFLSLPHDFESNQETYSTSHTGGEAISFSITYK